MHGFGIARLGRDAELKYTPSADAVLSLALAFDYGKKEDGKRPTQWVSASLWGKRAESLAPHLKKGQQVVVTLDDVHIRTWDKPDGGTGIVLEARVSSLEFAGSAPAQSSAAQPQRAAQDDAARTPPKPREAPPKAQQSTNFDDFDDDIPF